MRIVNATTAFACSQQDAIPPCPRRVAKAHGALATIDAADSGSGKAVELPRFAGVFTQFREGDRYAPLEDHHGVRLRQGTGLRTQTQVFARRRQPGAPVVDCRFNLHQGEFGHPFIPSYFRARTSIRAGAGVPALLHSTDCADLATVSSVFTIV